MRTTERGGNGRAVAVLSTLETTFNMPTKVCTAPLLRTRAAAIMTTARLPASSLVHGEGGSLGPNRTSATYAALQSMPMTPARRRRFQRTTRTDSSTSQHVTKRQGSAPQLSRSAVTAVATNDRVMLWTDGRYLLQAAQELDANRTVTLMQDRVVGTAPIQDWRAGELSSMIHRRLHLVSHLEQDGRENARSAALRCAFKVRRRTFLFDGLMRIGMLR
jgi:hypothetical protein